jgi:hypothetical protein
VLRSTGCTRIGAALDEPRNPGMLREHLACVQTAQAVSVVHASI